MDPYEAFENCEDEYLRFDRILPTDRLSESSFVCALIKIQQLDPHFETATTHDLLYAGTVREITQEDAIYLTRCGVHYEEDSFAINV